MPVPQRFYVPWADIDPTGLDGGIPGELGEFVGPDLGDNTRTLNRDILRVFSDVRDVAASISMHPEADMQGEPSRSLIEEILKGGDLVLERIFDRTRTQATRNFLWHHATPPYEPFMLSPVRYPVRSEFALNVLYYYIGAMVEVAELNANARHTSIDPATAAAMVGPFYQIKAMIMKDYFDVEVANEISMVEMESLFSGQLQPVLVETGSSGKRAEASAGESLQGANVVMWAPNQEDWVYYAKRQQERYVPERIQQPEAKKVTTEDVAPAHPRPMA